MRVCVSVCNSNVVRKKLNSEYVVEKCFDWIAGQLLGKVYVKEGLFLEKLLKKTVDPEQVQRDKDMQKNLALIAKYFKKIYKPTNNNLRTSSNSRNKNVDTSPRYKNDNQTGQFGNQRTVTVAGAR
ncbi:hypothetical protein Tco_1226429 [Tanacetum coccineum]